MKHKSQILMALAIAAGAAVDCTAQQYQNPFIIDPREPGTRSQRTEFYLLGEYWHAQNMVKHNVTLPTAPGPFPPLATGDINMQWDDAGMPGLGVAYNFNNHFAVDGEFTFGYPDYTMTWAGRTLHGEGFVSTGKFNLVYNLFSGPVTPFVSAGIGYMYVDSGIPSGPPDYYGWWDYWWGYTVVGVTPTYADTWFAANAAAGVRWDVNDQMFVRAIASGNWVDVGHSAGWPMVFTAGFEFGFKF